MSNYLVKPSELAKVPTVIPCHIGKGYIPKKSIVGIVALPNGGKSFVGLSKAFALAAQLDWHGCATECNGVIYVCGEGFPGMPGRFLALCDEYGIDPASLDSRLAFCRVPFDISEEGMRTAIHAEIVAAGMAPDVFFIDTLSSNSLPGFDENVTAQMKIMMDAARFLRDFYNASVVIIHHTGHEGKRARGSIDFIATMDVLLHVENDNNVRTLTVAKSRDFEAAAPMKFELVKRGESATLRQLGATSIGPTPAQRMTLLRLAEYSHGAPLRAADWARVSGFAKGYFYRIRQELETGKYVLKSRKGYVLTESGQAIVEPMLPQEDSVSRSHLTLLSTEETGKNGLLSSRYIVPEEETDPRGEFEAEDGAA